MVESEVLEGINLENKALFLLFSHNAGVNYANRNASQHTPVSKFLVGYLGAVTVSVSIAVTKIHFNAEKNVESPLIRSA